MKTFRIFLVLTILLSACAIESSQEIADRVDAYLVELEKTQNFSGMVLIAKGGEILLSKGYGMADRERQIPNMLQTHYRIHWITMPFTALAIMQLQAEGQLEVQDLICHYIPDCPEYWGSKPFIICSRIHPGWRMK